MIAESSNFRMEPGYGTRYTFGYIDIIWLSSFT